jgi:hypothetical protein
MNEMTQLAAQAAGTSSFNETALRSTLQAIATRARATPEDISQAIADGWAQGVKHAMQDGTLTADEEANLRAFRDRMADHDLPSVITGSTTLDRASADRITGMARRAALDHGSGALQELDNDLRRTNMSNTHRRQLLIRAWEKAVEGAIQDAIMVLGHHQAWKREQERNLLREPPGVETGGQQISLRFDREIGSQESLRITSPLRPS